MAYEIEQLLNVRSASAPSYSPDGQRIAFVSNLTGIPLLWVVPASGGWPHPLSMSKERTGQVVFSPSGQHAAFDRDHGGDEHWQLLVCNPEGGAVRPFTFDPDEDALVESQVARFPGLDGLEISGIVYAPRNAEPDSSHAAIVQAHGVRRRRHGRCSSRCSSTSTTGVTWCCRPTSGAARARAGPITTWTTCASGRTASPTWKRPTPGSGPPVGRTLGASQSWGRPAAGSWSCPRRPRTRTRGLRGE